MKKLIVVLVGCLISSAVFARGQATNLIVESVRIDKSGFGYVEFSSDLVAQSSTTLPECGTMYPKALAFDTNTEGGKAILSVVLMADATKEKIFARGANECTVYPGAVEDWDYGWTN